MKGTHCVCRGFFFFFRCLETTRRRSGGGGGWWWWGGKQTVIDSSVSPPRIASCENISPQSRQSVSFIPPTSFSAVVVRPMSDIEKLFWAPPTSPPRPSESEIRADLSHTPCLPSPIIVLLFHCVCICCRPSTVKSCNIFAKIFIHQPGLRHCRVNEQQLLAHSKWILPARYPT